MKQSHNRRVLSKNIASILALSLGFASSASAANVWDGGGGDNLWSTITNWDDDLFPGYGTLTFSGATQTTNVVDASISQNMLLWTGTNDWTLNNANGAVISLFDNGGAQAKVENQSSGLLTINAPITFAANNGTPPNPFGEINATSGNITFGSTAALTVNGSSVNGIKFWGGAGRTVTFNNTVSATGKWLATTGSAAITIGSTGSVTAADIYVMNGGALNLAGSLTSDAGKGVRLGGDFTATGNQNLALGGSFNLTPASGGLMYAGIVNSVAGNTSGALSVNSQNTSGTNTLSGFIVLDSNLAINQSAGGALNLTQLHTDGATGANGINIKTLALTLAPDTGATINVSGNIYSNTNAGSITTNGPGTVNLSAANNAANLFVRQGTVQIGNGGSFTGSAFSSIGLTGGDNGTVTLSGNGAMSVTTDLNVSDVPNTVGTLNMNSTGLVTSGTLFVGKTSAIGTLNQTTGSITTATLLVGAAGTAQGIYNQSGGSITRSAGGGDWRIGGNSVNNTVVDAANQNAVGIYVMTGGTLTPVNNFQIGASGQGYLSQSAGTLNSAGWTDAGRSAGSYGVIDVSGGTFNQTGAGVRLFAGENGFGHINVRGTGVMTLTGGLRIGNGGTTAGGVFNLGTGGTLTTALIEQAGVNTLGSTFNFNGGTLKPTAGTTTFTGIGTANIFAGGAIIDTTTAGFTIAQPLLAPAGNGVNAISIATGGSGFKAPPIVKLSAPPAGGTQATAIATIDGSGNITGFVITSPGTGYTAAPTVSFVSANGGTATATATIAANTSGGLTKNGANTLTLSGANTFTGNTTINAGVLLLNYATDVNYPGNITAAGGLGNGTAQFIKNGAGTLTLSGTITQNGANNNPVTIGNGAAGGTVTLTSTAVLTTVASELWVGNGAGGSAILNLDGGTLNVGNWIAIARGGAGGTLNMTAGTINKTGAGNITIGSTGGGLLNQSGGTINSTGSNFFVAEVAGTGTYTISGNAVANIPGLTFGQNAASTGTVNLNGGTIAATQIVKVNAGATATFNFNGGTLQARTGAATAFMTGLTTANVRNGGAVIDTNGQSITIGQALLHSAIGGDAATDGGLTKNGLGTLTLSAANTYTGNTVVNGGILALTGASASNRIFNTIINTGGTVQLLTSNEIGTSNITVNGGTLDFNTKIDYFNSLTMSNAGSVIGTGTSAFTLENAAPVITATGGGNAGTISAAYGITSGFGVSGNIARTAQFNVATSTSLTVSGAIRDTLEGTANVGSLTKTGNGTLLLSGTNTYTGPTAVNAGTLTLSGAGSANNTSGITVNGVGAKLLQTSSEAATPVVTLTQGTLDGTGTLSTVNVGAGTGGIVTNGNGTLGAALTIGALTFNGAANVNLFSNTTAAPLVTTTLTTTGAGTVSLTATNAVWGNGSTYNLISYTGAIGGAGFAGFNNVVTVNGLGARQSAMLGDSGTAVTLAISGDLPIWTGVASANWTSTPVGPTFNWKKQSDNSGTEFFAANDTPLFDDSATGTTAVNIADANVSPTSTTFNNSALNYTVSSAGGFGIASGLLLKNGTGSVSLTTANTYNGGTTLNAGKLNLNNASAIGTGTLTINGGTIDNTSGAPIVLSTANAQTWNSDVVFAGSNALDLGTGAITLSASRTVTTNGTAALTLSGAIGGVGLGLTKAGNGTLILSGANTFNGGVTINAGILRAGSSGAFNTTTPNVVSFGPGSTGILQLAGNNITVGGLSNNATVGTPVVENGTAGTATLNVSTAGTSVFGGTLQNGAAGTLALTKSGGGTLSLAGTNTYTTTSVTGGTLQIGNGSTTGTAGSGAITVGSGAMLAFNRSDAVSFANNISGAGSLSQLGGGTTTYTGAATHTGATNVTAGALVTEGTINGTTSLTVNTGGSAAFQAASSATINGPIDIGTVGAGNLTVGTSGTINQTGGVGIVIGANGGSGTYVQTGGVVNAGTATAGFQLGVGAAGSTGTATISGGTLNVPNEFWVSNGIASNSATMTMSAGTLNAGSWFVVGRSLGTGALNLSGGTITKGGAGTTYAIIGSLAGTGTITQTGGALNVTAGGLRIGENNGAIPALGGLWDMQGGSSTINGEVNVGWRSSEATWNIKPGAAVNVTGRLLVASETANAAINTGVIVNGAPVGTVNMTGGTATFTAGDSIIGGANSAVSVGANGTVSVSGGTMNFGGNLQIGAYGQGTMNVQGTGTVNSTGGFPVVGRFVGGVGTLTVDAGGTFNQTGVGAALILGEQGTGTLNIYGGGLTDVESLFLGHVATGNGTVNLIGGTLATKIVQRTDVTTSVAAFNFDGGTLKAKASAANFFPGFTNTQIKVEAGGATIDTNGFDIGVTQVISDGLTAGGGLTKVGNGKLTLSAAHTFTGVTSVNGGTLSLTGSISGSVAVNNGGTLGGTGTISGGVTANSGAIVSPGLSPGQLNTGAFTLNTGASLALEVNATGAGNYDVLNVTGGVTLGGTLSLSGTYLTTPTVTNDLFFGIINDGSDPITGTFAGVANGSHVFAPNGQDFIVSYFGDSVGGTVTGGNDFVLQAVPEPGSAALLLGGLAMLAGRRRRSAR